VLYTLQIIAVGIGYIGVYIVLCGQFSLEPFVDSSGQKTLLFQEMDDITF
jgi:hypothetical protein